MSDVVKVNNFSGSIADDLYEAGPGDFSIAKHFDTLSYPYRLKPLRGVMSDTANTDVGNMIVASDGLLYGVGSDRPNSNPTLGAIWKRSGYGVSDSWGELSNSKSGVGIAYPFLVEYKNGNIAAKTIYYAGTNKIISIDPSNGISATTKTLSFTNIGQGFVHPKDQILYFPYDNNIGTITNASETPNATQLVLPKQYQIPCLTNYGNYLAIPAFSGAGSGVYSSVVYLWDRDTSLSTVSESIPWGQGQLKVLNNLNGVLIGISTASSNFNSSVQDSDSILIKAYSGGTEPILIKEIIAKHLPGNGQPSVTINPNVNFIYKNRMYFSVNIVPNDGVSNSYYGLWSVGKNKSNGQYSVTLERIATNDNSETGVLAAAIVGDFVSMCHTAVGTLTCTINGTTSSSTYNATSVYESVINPRMGVNRYTVLHPLMQKTISAVSCHYAPLTQGAQVVMKYRADSTGVWTTIFTETTLGAVSTEMLNAQGVPFTKGRNFEFRLESSGGAEIIAFVYKYEIDETKITGKL